MKIITPLKESHISKNKQGMTIVETIVALVIFAVFISGAVKVIMAQRQVSDKARAHYTAINIAKNQIEQVRNTSTQNYNQIISMAEDKVRVNKDGVPDDFGKFRRTTLILDTSTDDLFEIDVKVDIFDPISLEFKGENEHIKSYMAKLLDR